MTTPTDALQRALAAEHAAIWGYGVVGAHLPIPQQPAAASGDKEHRRRRDALSAALDARGVAPQPAAATYDLPFAVVDAAGARRLAVHLEEAIAAIWRAALAALTVRSDRQLAVSALTDAAVRGVQWRRTVPGATLTVAFPGA